MTPTARAKAPWPAAGIIVGAAKALELVVATDSLVAVAACEEVEEAPAAAELDFSLERVGGVMVPQRSPMFFLQSS